MPVAAFPPTSDASVDPSSGNGLAAPRSQAPAAPGDDATPAFDQFLPQAKAPGTGPNAKAETANTPAPASHLPSQDLNSDPSNPAMPAAGSSPVGAMFRRSRTTSAAATADGSKAPAPAATTAATTAVDPSQVLPAFFPATLPPPPPTDETQDAELSLLPGLSGATAATASTSLLPAADAADSASATTASATALATLNAPAAALAGGAATMLPAASPAPRFAERVGKPANPTATTTTPLSTPSTTDPAVPESPGTDFGLLGLPPATLEVGAKIAAPSAAPLPVPAKAFTLGEKKTLSAIAQSDRQATGPVGIDAAQGGVTMSVDTPDLTAAVRLASLPTLAAPAATAPAAAAATSANDSARLAVDAVVKLVDAQTGRSQAPVSAVSLNFKFGSDDLAIRVEWRNGEVHTQFRTESSDLRSALASQWQAMAPSTAGRTTPFADPVFSTGGSSSASTTGAGPDARQYGQPGSSDLPGQSSGARPQRRTTPPRSTSPAAITAASVPPLPTSLRLHTFA